MYVGDEHHTNLVVLFPRYPLSQHTTRSPTVTGLTTIISNTGTHMQTVIAISRGNITLDAGKKNGISYIQCLYMLATKIKGNHSQQTHQNVQTQHNI